MRITQHRTNNGVFSAPDGMSHRECRSAPVTRTYNEEIGFQGVATYWEPTAEERAAIAAGALVRVEIMGTQLPPLYVSTENP